jgi:Phasin protein
MTRNENKVASSFPSLNLTEVSAMGQMQMEHLFGVQTKVLKRIQEASRVWLDRIQSEAKLASEFTEKVAKVDSLPEAIKAYQDWNTRRLTIMAEDGRRLVEEAQQFIRTGSSLLSNGWSGNGGASS